MITNNTSLNSENFSPSFALSPQIALGTMAWMVIRWMTEYIYLKFINLLAPFIFIIIVEYLLSIKLYLNFSDPIIWIFISGCVPAAALKNAG